MKQNDKDIAHVPQDCYICEIHGDTFVDIRLEGPELTQPTSVATPVVASSQSKGIRITLVERFSTL